jgi:hypothetical protein
MLRRKSMKKNLWVKLISVILIAASMLTLIACDSVEDESGNSSDSDVVIDNGERAEDLTPSENLTFTLTTDKKGYQLKSASKCKDEQVVIPSTYTGTDGKTLPVTTISAGAFKGNKTVVSVYIPDSVTKITGSGTNGAFAGLKSLTKVVCGSGLAEIGNRAFENCSELKTVILRNGLKKIGSYAFAGCESIETLIIPDTVTSIGEACFQRCARITSVTLGSGLQTQDTMDSKGNLVMKEDGTTPKKNVDEIGKFAFYFCKNISTIKYNGTKEEFRRLHVDVSVFLSVTMTKVVKCSDGEIEYPKLEGQNELPVETVKTSK